MQRQQIDIEGVEKHQFLKKKVDMWWCGEAAPPHIQYILSGKVFYKHPLILQVFEEEKNGDLLATTSLDNRLEGFDTLRFIKNRNFIQYSSGTT